MWVTPVELEMLKERNTGENITLVGFLSSLGVFKLTSLKFSLLCYPSDNSAFICPLSATDGRIKERKKRNIA